MGVAMRPFLQLIDEAIMKQSTKTIKAIKIILALAAGVISFMYIAELVPLFEFQKTAIEQLADSAVKAERVTRAFGTLSNDWYHPDFYHTVDSLGPGFGLTYVAILFVSNLILFSPLIIFKALVPLGCLAYILYVIKGTPYRMKRIISVILWILVFAVFLPMTVYISTAIETSDICTSLHETFKFCRLLNKNGLGYMPSGKEELAALFSMLSKGFGWCVLNRFVVPVVMSFLPMGIVDVILRRLMLPKVPAIPTASPVAEGSAVAGESVEATEAKVEVTSDAAETAGEISETPAESEAAEKTEEPKHTPTVPPINRHNKLRVFVVEVLEFIAVLALAWVALVFIENSLGIENGTVQHLTEGLGDVAPNLQDLFQAIKDVFGAKG